MSKPIHIFCELPNGTHNRQVDWSDGVKVLVSSSGGSDAEVEAVAALIAGMEEAIEAAEAAVKVALVAAGKATARIPPARPQRILGTAYARFADGKVWLLNRRETGFGSFGFWFESWDTLFRAFDVEITGHGVDEHGPWWSAANIKRDA